MLKSFSSSLTAFIVAGSLMGFSLFPWAQAQFPSASTTPVTSTPTTAAPEVIPITPIGTLTCIPVQNFSPTKKQIECRLASESEETFQIGEITFPFHVTGVINASSSYSAVVASLYPATVINNTVAFSAINIGNIVPSLQSASFDTLSFLVESDDSISTIAHALKGQQATLSYLVSKDVYKTGTLKLDLQFDATLILEIFGQYAQIGILQFLKLGLACNEKSAQECFTNLIQNL